MPARARRPPHFLRVYSTMAVAATLLPLALLQSSPAGAAERNLRPNLLFIMVRPAAQP